MVRRFTATTALCLTFGFVATARAADPPRLLQQPAISRDLIAFGYGGDI